LLRSVVAQKNYSHSGAMRRRSEDSGIRSG